MKRLLSLFLMLCFLVQGIHGMEHVPPIFKNLPQGVQVYINTLPRIAECSSCNHEEKAKIIANFLLRCGGYENKEITGIAQLRDKILTAIKESKPIIRCMPAFPVSSANPDKIPFDDEHAFSMGDLIGLLTRNHISAEISKVHQPGATIQLFWEPYMHDMNDMCMQNIGRRMFSLRRIQNYQTTLAKMITFFAPGIMPSCLTVQQINDLYLGTYKDLAVACNPIKMQKMRSFIEQDFNKQQIEQLLYDRKCQELEKRFPHLKGKTFEQIKNGPGYEKVRQELHATDCIRNLSAKLALIVHDGGRRVAKLMQEQIPDYKSMIRESVRPDPNDITEKIGTQIIYNVNGTPWHNTLVVNNSGVNLEAFKKIKQGISKIRFYNVADQDFGYIDESDK